MYQRSAEKGFAFAQFRLGQLFHEGNGVIKDYAEAYKWLNLAAAQGVSDAGRLREKLAEKMSPEQIALGQERASAFVPRVPDISK